MIKLHSLIASVLGVGYVKGGGTIAAIIYCIVWMILPAGFFTNGWQVLITGCIIIVGIWSSDKADADWGKDSSKVVIDEVAGMAIALLYVPQQWGYMIGALAAFRFFDIVKPLGVRTMERFPKGWGVMADDILAGIYALLVMQLSVWLVHTYS